jgi:hypothetical protein
VSRRWKRLIALIVLLVGIVYGCVVLDHHLDPFDDQPFNATLWAQATEQERGPMARDAFRFLPAGLSAQAVREVLGEPGEILLPGAADRWGMKPHDAETWPYWLGCWSAIGPYGFDSAFLYVHFDRNGCVARAEITGG